MHSYMWVYICEYCMCIYMSTAAMVWCIYYICCLCNIYKSMCCTGLLFFYSSTLYLTFFHLTSSLYSDVCLYFSIYIILCAYTYNHIDMKVRLYAYDDVIFNKLPYYDVYRILHAVFARFQCTYFCFTSTWIPHTHTHIANLKCNASIPW